MEKKLKLDEAKYKLFMLENNSWQNCIVAQESEMPQLKKRLVEAMLLNEATAGKRETFFFCSELTYQHNEMKKLENDITIQQQRLSKDCELQILYDIEVFCTQDILRERIRAIEKMYIDLKCNFLNYLSTIS